MFSAIGRGRANSLIISKIFKAAHKHTQLICTPIADKTIMKV